ncbi:phosphoribosylglycinamide formyltransferase [Bacillus cytotoxicus]|uniref:Phosphoribosylglycinamide formyltransferase n=2 Tax=Bacillus cytotoxicus TaxID=580165 RepID=A0AAX2CBW9_9BACI|nr:MULTISPECIES: phosphoribosylglycinamide formyltransferase [Bacillus cereus group]ABS20639.1 phosphoribosylglycinamide formyltransferase [Bacillus cytotoxicus NVH 391-98]AWC27273.1 phosphoribosylglycinamide formyltransferase [Bacillus cytotoxicus]AWC31310.1 phosphoribosylglycinamide formyltransferase [Bacillus cytotoxicus]AWC35351.1 phosphoribosylglycinamide formyltransferase [Bacillus cytotoxicus]AWC39386.1 phosphoribosylglycinamide formyltransferase [Bacillus cytotoxicus]
MNRLAIFASGSGSNFQAFVNAVEENRLHAEISLLVCDQPEARVIGRAHYHHVPCFAFSAKAYESKEAFEKEILKKLREYEIDFVILAGYMRLIGPTLLEAYGGKIINIHPSLLPSFPGKDAIGQALKAGVGVTGVTIHYVDAGMDTGPVIAQEAVQVSENDTRDSLQKKIQQVEHRLYVNTVNKIIQSMKERTVK